MNNSVDEKKECAKKIMHAIGELPDDMISKANPENWKDGVYVGNEAVRTSCDEKKKTKLAVIGEWAMKKRKIAACAAALLLCVLASGVWKMNSIDEHIENNDSLKQQIEQTSLPENTAEKNNSASKKTKKSDKTKKQKVKKKISKKTDSDSIVKTDNDAFKTEDETDSTSSPDMQQYSDEEGIKRRKAVAGDTDTDNNSEPDTKAGTTAEPSLSSDNDVSSSSDSDTSEESVTAYKIDSQGNKTSVNIAASDETRIISIISGKKYISDTETNGSTAILKYKGNDYYFDSKAKMLIVSGKGAGLSESENAELKEILKLD